MTKVLSLLQSTSAWVWTASWQATIIAALVMITQWAFRRQLAARWRNALWLLVFARLLMPVLPAARLSAFNWLTPKVPLATKVVQENPSRPLAGEPVMTSDPELQSRAQLKLLFTLLALAWGTGFVVTLGLGVAGYIRQCQRAVRFQRRTAEPLQEMFDVVKTELGVHRVELTISEAVATPIVSGVWKPVVTLPVGLESALQAEEIRMVLFHELAHVKRGDIWMAWLAWLAGALHWFNPAIRFALARARKDREMACDEWVLRFVADSNAYGSALVRFLESRQTPTPQFGTIGIFESNSALIQRVKRIAAYRRPSFLGSAIGAILLIVVGTLTLTGAVNPKESTSESPKSPPTAKPKSTTPVSGFALETRSRFIEISESSLEKWLTPNHPLHEMGRQLRSQGRDSSAFMGSTGILSTAEADSVVQQMSRIEDSVLISAPRFTARSGQEVEVQLTKAFKYPTEYAPKKEGEKVVTPTAFDTKQIGPSLDIMQTVSPDGEAIDVKVTAQVIDLVGVIHYTDKGTIPFIIKPKGPISERVDETIAQAYEINRSLKTGVAQPVFSIWKVQTSASIFAGQTFVVGGVKPAPENEIIKGYSERRFLFVFVTPLVVGSEPPASRVEPTAASPAVKNPKE
ncbi:MAG: M56 family metallopeptidase [Chthoniobacteraceae bacterium]